MISWLCDTTFAAGLLTGAAVTILLLVGTAVFFIISRDHYGLDHWKLNIDSAMPVRSMWMNLGYWRDSDEFPEACRAYLLQVLETANILTGPASVRPIAILDVGIGCGDQTQEVIGSVRSHPRRSYKSPLAYVGITINQAQHRVASEKCMSIYALAEHHPQVSFDLFCADASKPRTWSEAIQTALGKFNENANFSSKWLLASDCLYHFSPSRMPLWQYAAGNLDMNFMGSDLCMSKTATFRQRILARMIGALMGCPWKAFLTEEEYREQLTACGYDKKSIIIVDVSGGVFPGLVGFLERQDTDLAEFGISLGGGFRLARRVFGWFATSGVIRAVIVVAKLPQYKDGSYT